MKNIPSGSRVRVEAGGESLISSAGGSMLLQTAAVSGLAAGLWRGLASWRPARSVNDPGKTVLDLAVTIALGGDCLADVAALRDGTHPTKRLPGDPVGCRFTGNYWRRRNLQSISRYTTGINERLFGREYNLS